ncbi:hypothetical protein AVEN_54109-1 [Araneus ventricosus]|uniref:Uncharacterized protein n=1 Tax=Araneus ventricosus TaxID=182803 RepID=A0A4Y2BTG6_ARAVE|nr:hypothetical protein AVEN_54109-1 [Araneus ventricosus]
MDGFLLSRTQRENIVIIQQFFHEIFMNLHVSDLPELKNTNFGIMSNTITRKRNELDEWNLVNGFDTKIVDLCQILDKICLRSVCLFTRPCAFEQSNSKTQRPRWMEFGLVFYRKNHGSL